MRNKHKSCPEGWNWSGLESQNWSPVCSPEHWVVLWDPALTHLCFLEHWAALWYLKCYKKATSAPLASEWNAFLQLSGSLLKFLGRSAALDSEFRAPL
ncbi:hypothetical protein SRHO_G00229920 [Serrasalmus rhombeus]